MRSQILNVQTQIGHQANYYVGALLNPKSVGVFSPEGVTKNCCMTRRICEYANLVSKFRVYLISPDKVTKQFILVVYICCCK